MSDNTVTLKGRLVHKHDTEAHWNLATNFAPLLGETIIYDPDETHPEPRYKTGIWDGVSEKTPEMMVTNLPFIDKNLSKIGHTHSVTTASTAPSGHLHTVTVKGTTGTNSGTAVTALTGVKVSSSASAAPGGHTHAYDRTTGITLTSTEVATDGSTTYVESISGSKPSLGGTKTFVTGVNGGSGSLTSDTTATNGIKYVESISSGSGSLVAYNAGVGNVAVTS